VGAARGYPSQSRDGRQGNGEPECPCTPVEDEAEGLGGEQLVDEPTRRRLIRSWHRGRQGIFGTTELTTALFQALAWVINLAVAEWALRRPSAVSRRRLALVADAS
jgi:hypothetical protein